MSNLNRGDIYWLPPHATMRTGSIPHAHALLTDNNAYVRQTLVLGTSQTTEPDRGAFHLRYMPTPQDGSGLNKPTYFLAHSLGRAVTKNLPRPAGTIAPVVSQLVSAVREALGFGSGPGYAQPIGSESLRGRVVCLTSDVQKRLDDIKYAVVMTSHAYSAQRADQVIVPLDLHANRTVYPQATSFVKAWAPSLFDSASGSLVALGRMVFAVYQPAQIHSVLNYSIDAPDLLDIEREIQDWLTI